ncbi:hypothetical protein RRG08_002420 [Elysia crispata]|uniref:Uncharacterized protein n=1 Tax=Elysia crispata TaxID=231223 RepID=A0AAE0ZFT0_9GAST|nr:hypothetical protein RRG08_002420 [Elysia crispata]
MTFTYDVTLSTTQNREICLLKWRKSTQPSTKEIRYQTESAWLGTDNQGIGTASKCQSISFTNIAMGRALATHLPVYS